ncbi:MAG: hypothetical protein P1V36_00890 [Planctomycetota bacterium]|nr:hypothetical protein [Planctomycetota bacterium]
MRRLSCLVLLSVLGVGVCWPAARSVGAAEEATPRAGEVARLLDGAVPFAQRCELRYLLHLGWRFERDATVKDVVVEGGHPGRYRTIARAHAAGALRVRVPASFDAAAARAFGPRLVAMADGIPSRLAYQHKLAPALRRSAARFMKLEAAGRYEFPKLFELVNSPFWGLRLPETSWTAIDGVYVAYGSSARALESIWARGAVAECYTGQWLAIFGAHYELYGPRWFERVFAANDLQIGKPSAIKTSPIGHTTSARGRFDYRALVIPRADQYGKDAWLVLAPHGPMAFIGLTGIMRNTDPEGGQMNENWVITKMSPAAVEAIRAGGGQSYLQAQAAKIWALINKSMGGGPLRVLQEPSGREVPAVEALLAQPAFAETWVYVHPHGVINFAELMRNKFIADDTPPEFLLYRTGRESLLYRRYHRAWLARCGTGGPCR